MLPRTSRADKPLQVRPFINHDDTQPIDLDYILETYPQAKKIALSVPDIGYDGMVERIRRAGDGAGHGDSGSGDMDWGTTDFVPVMTKLNGAKPGHHLGHGQRTGERPA